MSICYWCPFSACIGCIHQGGDTPTQQGRKPGLTCENRGTTETVPFGAGNASGDLTTERLDRSR